MDRLKLKQAIEWFDDLSTNLQTEGRLHWKTIKSSLIQFKEDEYINTCPSCKAIDQKVMGFPWSHCDNCGHVYRH